MDGQGKGFTRLVKGGQSIVFICTDDRHSPCPIQYGQGHPRPIGGNMIVRLHAVDAAWNLAFENWYTMAPTPPPPLTRGRAGYSNADPLTGVCYCGATSNVW